MSLGEGRDGRIAWCGMALLCFVMAMSLVGPDASRSVVKKRGFHFPSVAPQTVVSECNPPYCVSLYKDGSLWNWVACKQESQEKRKLGSGRTESYSLSRDIALTFVDEDKKHGGGE